MRVESPELVKPAPIEAESNGAGTLPEQKGFMAFAVFCAREVQEFLTHNSMQMAAAIAFYSFFSLFPLSLLIILGYDQFAAGEGTVREEQLTRVIGAFIPVSQDVIARTINSVAGSWGAAGPVAFAGLIWASTAVFATLRKGINATWNIWTPRPFLKERVIDLGITAGAGVLFMLLLYSSSFIRSFDQPVGLLGGSIWQSGLSLGISFLAFAFLYWFLPNRIVPIRDVLFGAAIAALAIEIAKTSFFFYTRERVDLNQVYGSMTSVAILLGWLYTSAAIVLIGSLTASINSRLVQVKLVSYADVWSLGLLPAVRRLRKRLPVLLKSHAQA